jgi:hypothetical protein
VPGGLILYQDRGYSFLYPDGWSASFEYVPGTNNHRAVFLRSPAGSVILVNSKHGVEAEVLMPEDRAAFDTLFAQISGPTTRPGP